MTEPQRSEGSPEPSDTVTFSDNDWNKTLADFRKLCEERLPSFILADMLMEIGQVLSGRAWREEGITD